MIINLIKKPFEPIVYAKGEGSGWVFWYYFTDGERSCGNYCIITFSATGFLILFNVTDIYCNICTKKGVKTIIVKLSSKITFAAVIAWKRSSNEYRLECTRLARETAAIIAWKGDAGWNSRDKIEKLVLKINLGGLSLYLENQ
ncbi:hypothetical protein Glove_187g125 [Diversispora epigaea]|uniref:Uncharacterized protein n=1 Tax=Diversispora epigaea TaxID=1348612 RepID=A0A397IT62_9GLOM|nr:hypothetical protein Glove_187g125 [Diversispora epigaea]